METGSGVESRRGDDGRSAVSEMDDCTYCMAVVTSLTASAVAAATETHDNYNETRDVILVSCHYN